MDFQTAITALCDAQVQFVVVGGVAAWYLLLTGAFEPQAAGVCPGAFSSEPRGLPSGLPFVWDEVTLSNTTVLTLQTTLGEIDLLAEIAGLGDYAEVKARSIAVQAFGRHFLVLDLPNLIRAKRAAGRAKDLAALPELEGLDEAQRE